MKNSFLLISFLLLGVSSLWGKVDSLALKYADQLTISGLKEKLQVLANDSLLGRETADIGQKKAEKYITDYFSKENISPAGTDGYLQEFNVRKLDFDSLNLVFNETWISSKEQLFSVGSFKDSLIQCKSVQFVGHGISNGEINDYKDLNVEGKLVFVLDGTPKNEKGEYLLSDLENRKWMRDKNLKVKVALENGASAIGFVMNDLKKYENTYKRYLRNRDLILESEKEDELFAFFIYKPVFYSLFDLKEEKAEQYMMKKRNGKRIKDISKDGPIEISVHSNTEIKTTSNILAKVEAKDSLASWIVISAHYDHVGYDSKGVYNGADDNGSGTSTVLEIAKAFNNAYMDSVELNHNILFLLVSGEEKGLLGSKHYVSSPSVELNNIMTNLNIDMIGREDAKHTGEEYVYIVGADRASLQLNEINEEMNETYTHLLFDYTYNEESDPNRYFYRSDHYNFAKNGIPIIFYYNGEHNDYHKISDTEDKINYPLLLKRSKLIFHTAWYLARLNGELKLESVEQ